MVGADARSDSGSRRSTAVRAPRANNTVLRLHRVCRAAERETARLKYR